MHGIFSQFSKILIEIMHGKNVQHRTAHITLTHHSSHSSTFFSYPPEGGLDLVTDMEGNIERASATIFTTERKRYALV